MPGADRDPILIEDRAEIVRMHGVHDEREDAGFVARRAGQPQAGDVRERVGAIGEQIALVAGDAIEPDGRDIRECCVEAYMQFLKPGEQSGKHRHMWEEVLFVVEGSGYDLHWDLKFDCLDAFEWEWTPEPRKFEWERGDFIYVPPFTIHQHFNSHATSEARLIVISNRMVKEMGFDWFVQIENAPGY